jgi:uncharacterized membrane protein
MTREQFLSELRDALRGLPAQEVEEILADYRAHFDEARVAGRAEEQVAAALGNPARLARELRAEAGLRRWQSRHTPGNFLGAVVALCGLAAVDLFVLLPVVCVLGFSALLTGFVLFVVSLVGVAMLAGSVFGGSFWGMGNPLGTGLAGVGLLAGGIGWGALLLLAMDGMLKLLSRYARLHYQLIQPTNQPG